jgi:hypothetical protein
MFSNFFKKLCHLCDNVEKHCRAGQATDDYMVHAGYLRLQIHTLKLYNTHCFSTATTVAWMCLNVMLHAHCLYCFHRDQCESLFSNCQSLVIPQRQQAVQCIIDYVTKCLHSPLTWHFISCQVIHLVGHCICRKTYIFK